MKKEIYLAAGCFWGTQKYLSLIQGVLETAVGYANGFTQQPTYEEVCEDTTGYAESVKIVYDDERVSLDFLLKLFFDTIEPNVLHFVEGETQTQYRAGIYYLDDADKIIATAAVASLQADYEAKVTIEVLPLERFYLAEEYHQNYLDKHPGSHCHINSEMFTRAKQAVMQQNDYRDKRRSGEAN